MKFISQIHKILLELVIFFFTVTLYKTSNLVIFLKLLSYPQKIDSMMMFNFNQNRSFYSFDYLERVFSSVSHYSNSPFKRIRAGKTDKHNGKFNNNMKVFSLPRDISRT